MSTSIATKSPAIAQSNNANRKQMFLWLLTIGLPLLVMLIPVTEVFTSQMRIFFAGTLCAILLFAFELLPQLIPALFLPVFYVVTEVAPVTAVFGPWSTTIPWMFLGGILLANCLESTGILRRIAYWCIIKTGGTYKGILYGVMFAGIILNILIPAQAVIPMAAFTYGICMALNLGKSKESAGIMLTGAFAALLPLFFFYNPNFAIITGAASTVYSEQITWIQFFTHNIPGIFWCFFMVFVVSKVFKPSKPINCKDYVTEEYNKLGRLSTSEKKAIFVTSMLVLFLVTGGLHGIDIGWGFAFAGIALFLPGINIGTENDIKRINYSLLFFVTACMSIGAAANVLGLGQLLAEAMMPLLSSNGIYVTIGLIWLLCVLSNFLLTPLAIFAAFTAPLTEVALKLGIDPKVFFYTIFQGADQIIMPYEYALVLIFFSFGLIHLKDFIKIFSIKMVLNLVFLLAILVPYWKIIGLL
ncbi:SLC13 family permease [Peptococcaceae bacterium 1198_IL3148]